LHSWGWLVVNVDSRWIPERVNQAVYDAAADAYVEAFASDTSDDRWLDEFVSRVKRRGDRGQPVLDLGCGPGIHRSKVEQHGIETIGVDLSERMLQRGLQQHPGWVVVQANMEKLPFKDNSRVGGALICYSLLHLPKPAAHRALAEIARVLGPGRPILLTLKEGRGSAWIPASLVPGACCYVSYWTVDEAIAALEGAGVIVDDVDEQAPVTSQEIQETRLALFCHVSG
jgi:SAM-dependent methyltransferase